jgi:hypothetical protein
VFTVDYFHHRIHLWVYGSNKYFYYLFKHLFNKIITIKMFLLKKQKGCPQAFGSAKKITHTLFCVSNYYKEVITVAGNGKVGLAARAVDRRGIEVNLKKTGYRIEIYI